MGFNELLEQHGFEPLKAALFRIALRRYLAAGESKRDFLSSLIDGQADLTLVLLADAAIDFYSLHCLRQQPEDSSELLALARQNAPRNEVPMPPADLICLVTGAEDPRAFLSSGQLSALNIFETLESNGLDLEALPRILDFGCGCGRVLRILARIFDRQQWHGSDLNPRLIEWCREGFGRFPYMSFHVNELASPTGHDTESFDFIYALSVFTHLDRELQQFWMTELRRILRPGGLLLITTHGTALFDQMTAGQRVEFTAGKMVVHGTEYPGENHCASFCPESYVRGTLAREFEVVDFRPGGARGNGHQDIYLLRGP